MKHKENKEKYKIKVNRLTSENEKQYQYSNYLGNEYSHFKKRVPNNSILYQLKFKPDIIINEYHQTSNNINTNINIKTNPSQNQNIRNMRIINDSSQPSDDNRIFKNEGKSGVLFKYKNNSRKNINNRSDNNNNSEIFSPFSNKNSVNSRDTNYKKRNINYIKNLNKNIYQTPINDTKINKSIQINSVNYGNDKNSNFSGTENNPINHNISYQKRNVVNSNSNNSQDMTKFSNALNIQNYENKRNNLSIGSYYNNKTRSESSVESLRAKKMREMNDIIFSSGNKINTIFSNRLRRKNNSNLITNYNNSNNSKDLSTNVKLEYYRIKLFKEFLKHFQLFYKSYIQKYFIIFLNKIQSHKKYHKRYQNSLIYNKKSYLRNISTIEGNAQSQTNIYNSNKYGLNLIEVFKSSNMNDYYKMYKQLKKNKSINPRLRLFNNSSNNLNNLSTSSKSNHYINSAPRINKYANNLSVKRNEGNKSLFNANSKSPSFRFGNKTYINTDISFANEGNQKENELYRDSKELNKKYEQIQRRKKILEMKKMNKETNKSVDIAHMKKSDEFKELKEYKHNVNSENKLKEDTKSESVASRNTKNKLKNDQLIKISSYDENLNNNDENNKKEKERKYNLNFSKTCYSYQFRNEKSKNDNNENKDKDTDINIDIKSDYIREGRTGMLRKNKNRFNSKKNFLNITTDENKNKKLIKDKADTNANTSNTTNNLNNDKNEEKNLQKVKVNINLKLMNNNKENNITKNKTVMNKINTSNKNNKIINYNYPIPTNSKNNSPTKNKNNIYYSKNSKINFTSTIIKNIMTKDKRIYINIYYYTFSKKNNIIRKKIYNLCKSENISITLLAVEQKKNKLTNLKLILSSIKEEDISNQNSKIFDESGTFGGNNTNKYENRKNCIHYNLNEKIYKQFIDIIQKLIINKYKTYFFDKIKSINNDHRINNNKN